MDILGVEHIGVAVIDLDAAAKRIEEVFGIKCKSRERVEASKVEVAFFQVGDTKLELVTPIAEGSAVGKFLAERGSGLHHICLKVRNIEQCLEELAGKGVDLIDKKPRQGAFGHTVAFLSPKSISNILIELSEQK